jgi:hypothetical protein
VSAAVARAAGDVSLTFMQSAVRIERRQARQRSGFFAADAAELRHSDDERQCGSLAQAGNAQHEREPAGEIGVTCGSSGAATRRRGG